MTLPKITIGLTLFNGTQYLSKLFACISGQDYPNLELVAVDDFSSDDTPEKFREIFESLEMDSLLVCNSENKGVGYCRNVIHRQSKGSFIAFFDQDDISHPARISLQFQRYCEARRRISSAVPLACYCAGKKYYNGSNWLPILPIGQGVNIVDAKILVRSTLVRESREIDLEVGSGTPCATAFFAVSDLNSVGGFDPDFRRVEDLELVVRFAKQGGYCTAVPEDCVSQIHTTRGDKSPKANSFYEMMLLDKHKAFFEREGLLDYALRWTRVREAFLSGSYLTFGINLSIVVIRYPFRSLRHFSRSSLKRLKIMIASCNG